MHNHSFPARLLSALLIALMLSPQFSWATCGGGGGGGTGGMSGGASQQTYQVPWRLINPEDAPAAGGLVVYWFPTGADEFQKSSLRESRTLSLYSQQCVTMGVVDVRTPLGQKFVPDAKLPVVVLATADGTVVNRLENTDGRLKVENVEKLVESEFKKRDEAAKQQMEEAKSKAKAGDNASAMQLYRSVYAQKCLFPKRAKDAAKELK